MATRLDNPYLWAYAAAILLHILLLLLENPLWRATIIVPQTEKIPVSPPLTFEFVDVPQNRDDDAPKKPRCSQSAIISLAINRPLPYPKATCHFPMAYHGRRI